LIGKYKSGKTTCGGMTEYGDRSSTEDLNETYRKIMESGRIW